MNTAANTARPLAADPDWFYHRTAEGVFVPREVVAHRNEEYNEAGFDILSAMQERHFWYRGRHRFLLYAVRRLLRRVETPLQSGIDLGGGCGGWIRYLSDHAPGLIPNLALGDSSRKALAFAEKVIGPHVSRYQIDLMRLRWTRRWDVAFLLDVLEHIPQDAAALAQIGEALNPGGYLFVTTPAFRFFWSYNDDIAEHQRRYTRTDFQRLADGAGLELCSARYFMFFLSPLLYLSRLRRRDLSTMSGEEILQLVRDTHRVPAEPGNGLLSAVFGLETPLGHYLPFPWGTSVFAVLRKPE